ncbi:hypothetical protein KFE94_12725 [bacterium SCSIO 12643]|nr:hypothetical protein KFE94_12725 [bacterium SCSIO 12643]
MDNVWGENIDQFIDLANKYKVKMLLVGGGAVNFHGYQRHSADVDFWIETSAKNFENLILVLNDLGYEITDFPDQVKKQLQNISIKFSPTDLNLELITKFTSSKTFEEAYKNSELVEVNKNKILKWRVLSYDDLISSKLKAQRPKDLLDIQQLEKLRK